GCMINSCRLATNGLRNCGVSTRMATTKRFPLRKRPRWRTDWSHFFGSLCGPVQTRSVLCKKIRLEPLTENCNIFDSAFDVFICHQSANVVDGGQPGVTP